jgi:tetratricopeptide (TPR) repeat protein
MTISPRKPILALLTVASIAVVAAAGVLYFLNTRTPPVPEVDLSAMEPGVRQQIARFSSAVRASPESADAWANLGQVFHAHDLFPQAIAAYGRAMERAPRDPRWPYLAALAQAKSDPRAAVPLFRQATALQPANAAVYINFGDLLMRLGELGPAQDAYRQALRIDAESSHALYGLAQAALARGETGAAIDFLQRAEALAPQHGEIHSLLAQAHQRAGNEDEARRESLLARAWPDSTRAPDPVVQAMESLAMDSQSLAREGVRLSERGEYPEAEAAFRRVLEIRPGNARDYANLGGVLAGQGRAEEALAAYRQGLEIDPLDLDNLNNLGYTLLQLQRYDEAEEALQRALEIDPGFAPALGNLGLLAEQRQQPTQAIAYYEQALEADPGLRFARQALATLLAATGDSESAAAHWRLMLEFNPADLSALYNLATVQAALGEHAAAIDLLRRGLEIAPNSSRLVAALAWELATAPDEGLRNGAEALALAQRLAAAYPEEPQVLDVLAAALAETGDFENAVEVMEKAVALDGQESQPLVMRLKAYRLGQPWRQPVVEQVTAPQAAQDR